MSLNDSSAVILIVGALAVLAFVIHGLWFSGRSINRKLVKGNKEDQEIVKSEGVGKVRIVSAKEPSSQADLKLETFGQAPGNAMPNSQEQPSNKTLEDAEITITNALNENSSFNVKFNSSCEINVLCEQDRPYRGLDIQELCNKFGFIRGPHNIFYVFENPQDANPIVAFRICSLEPPYNFPLNMNDYKTSELALYMNIPAPGKALPYFKAMRMAASIIISQLGGTIRDNYEKTLSEDDLNRMEEDLYHYDNPEAQL